MSEIKTGGRAFPWCGDLNETPTINLDMTLRDYFAAKAMGGMLADPAVKIGTDERADLLARSAYRIAGAMIRARGE
jgi:hypothetical protein